MVSTTEDRRNDMIQVRDGNRTLQFEGELIGHSTSRHQGSTRWVEFNLFKTVSGVYVLSRVGRSLLYHVPQCGIVERNSLKIAPSATLDQDAVRCDVCRPDPEFDLEICPEKPRFWAQACNSAHDVVDALYKYDASDNPYLTLVAQRLLQDAGSTDPDITSAWQVETIP